MLWYKGWLETRLRIVFALAMVAYSLAMAHWGPAKSLEPRQLVETLIIFWMIVPILLGGAGIKTPAAFRSVKGMHGSMLYTLTLPVGRFRLVLVRAGIGLFEMAGIFLLTSIAALILSPVLHVRATFADALENALVMTICGGVAYFVSVLLATFLDDVWQIWGSMLTVVALRLIPWPSPLNLFQAMGAGSPLVTHSIPWASMGTAMFASLLLLWTAIKIAEAREYESCSAPFTTISFRWNLFFTVTGPNCVEKSTSLSSSVNDVVLGNTKTASVTFPLALTTMSVACNGSLPFTNNVVRCRISAFA
jgi:hypothetical protein